MIYGYARVSGVSQELYGTSLDDQVKKLTEAGASVIYKEQYTGTKVERPEFQKLLNVLKEGDTLAVTKLDRFARTAGDGIKLVQSLMDKGVKVHILNMGLLDNTPTGKLIVNVMLSFAEFERDMIIERTQAGKAAAKAQGKKTDGRYKKDPDDFQDWVNKVKSKQVSITKACKEMGICRQTYYNLLKEKGLE